MFELYMLRVNSGFCYFMLLIICYSFWKSRYSTIQEGIYQAYFYGSSKSSIKTTIGTEKLKYDWMLQSNIKNTYLLLLSNIENIYLLFLSNIENTYLLFLSDIENTYLLFLSKDPSLMLPSDRLGLGS